MTEGVGRNGFIQPGGKGGLPDGFLNNGNIQMMAFDALRYWINGTVHRGKNILPGEFPGGGGVLLGKRIGQGYFAVSFFQISLVDQPGDFDLFFQFRYERIGQEGGAIFFAFAVADGDGFVVEVNIFDPQAQAFRDAQPAAIQEFGDQFWHAGHFADDRHGLLMGENSWQTFGAVGADDIGWEDDLFLENVFVQELDGAERLVLGRGSNLTLVGKVGDVGLNFFGTHILWMALLVKENEACDPLDVGLFGAIGIMFDADGFADKIEQFFRFIVHVYLASGVLCYNFIILF